MKQLADGVWQLSGFPPNAINVFVIEDVLIDASTRYATRRILRQVDGHKITAHALTHAHPDHQGASHNVCERLGIPFWVGEADADAAENPDLIGERQPDHFIAQLFFKTCTGPGHPVDRKLARATRSPASRSSHVPGHSAGHVAFWRESDRVLIAGDVLNSADPFTGIPGLRAARRLLHPRPGRRTAARPSASASSSRSSSCSATARRYRDTKKFVDFCAALPGLGPALAASAALRARRSCAPIVSSICADLARVRAERGQEVLGDPARVDRPHPLEHLAPLVGELDVEAAPVGRRTPCRSTSPSLSIRSISRLRPLLESSTRSASSTWRRLRRARRAARRARRTR